MFWETVFVDAVMALLAEDDSITRERLSAYLRGKAEAPDIGPLIAGAYGEALEMVDDDFRGRVTVAFRDDRSV